MVIYTFFYFLKPQKQQTNSLKLIKTADLGVAAQLTNTMDNRKTATGTPYWMAPELILEQAYTSEVKKNFFLCHFVTNL